MMEALVDGDGGGGGLGKPGAYRRGVGGGRGL